LAHLENGGTVTGGAVGNFTGSLVWSVPLRNSFDTPWR
jgi:hypothetical protein